MNFANIAHLYMGTLAQGAWVTIELTVVATSVALSVGVLIAIIRIWGPKPLKLLATAFVEVVRGTPQILQLFIIFFGLSQFGINLPAFVAALIWLAVYGAAYSSEVFRGGLASVDKRQQEAAEALGLSQLKILRRIIIPQAFAIILPSLVNFLVLQLKASSLVYTIGVADIMYRARLGADATANPGGLYLIAAGFYLVLNLVISHLGTRLERRQLQFR